MLDRLQGHYALPRSSIEVPGAFPNEAAVLVAITDDPVDPTVILTKRAEHLAVHSGEVSFPGGKWEAIDSSLIDTALREAQEEIGLAPEMVTVINVEPSTISRGGMKVTPYVGVIPAGIDFVPDPNELDAVFEVPLRFFFEDKRARTDVYTVNGQDYWSPVYLFDDYEIWGLTARVLIQFLNRAFGAGIERDSEAPVFFRTRGGKK